MYGIIGGGSAAGASGAGALAATGFNSLALIVAATTLFAAGMALWKLAPRRNRA